MQTKLSIEAGLSSEAGIKPLNEDSAGIRIPSDDYNLSTKGAVILVADGVSSAEAGQEASRIAEDRFIEEYYLTPDTWPVSRCGQKILSTINLRLFRKSQAFTSQEKGYLSTFSGVIFKAKTAHFFHVGDSRIYLLRDNELKQLTRDHIVDCGDPHSPLARALGMDSQLQLDYGRVEIKKGDCFLAASDGVFGFIEPKELIAQLHSNANCNTIAERLVQTALKNHSDDNVSAVVAKVCNIALDHTEDSADKPTYLPFPPQLKQGMILDGFIIKTLLQSTERSELYLVRDVDTRQLCVMKTLRRELDGDDAQIERFIEEEWIGLRLQNSNIAKVIKLQRKRQYLYYIMEYIEGQTLDHWMQAHYPPSPKKAIHLTKQIADGLATFHEYETIHFDLNPKHILVTKDLDVKIIGFSKAYLVGVSSAEMTKAQTFAKVSTIFTDPIALLGHNPGIKGDVYSLGTIVYHLFTGQLPYGEKILSCKHAFEYDQLRYQSASQHFSVIPKWFDVALSKAVDLDSAQRYSSVDALIQDLCTPNPHYLKDEPKTRRSASTLFLWKILSGFWGIIILLVVYLFAQR